MTAHMTAHMMSATDADLDLDLQKVLEFRDGIPGFPASHRFMLSDLSEDGSFQLLTSLDEEVVSMVVSVPWQFFPEYKPEIDSVQERELGLSASEEAIVFCPVTLDGDAETIYFNLLGPFIVNSRTRQGRQVVLADNAIPFRAPLALSGA